MKTKCNILLILLSMVLVSCASISPKVHHSPEQSSDIKESLEKVAEDLSILQDEIQSVYIADANWYEKFNPYSKSVEVTGSEAKIFRGADFSADIVTKAKIGQYFNVVDKINDWYAVSFTEKTYGKEIGWLNASQVVPRKYSIAVETNKMSSLKDRMYRKIMKSVIKFRDKYEKNPYIKVNGFSIDIGFPPSVSLDFEFK